MVRVRRHVEDRERAAPLGLTASEAARRLADDGPNELPRAQQRTLLGIAFETLSEPMFGLLLAASAIYLMLGDLAEALILTGFATLSVVVAVVQQVRSEHVLEALRDLTAPRALVIRDGRRSRVPGADVVRGDLIVLAEGDRVPADGHLIEAHDLALDESLLTGESVPVRKRPWRDGGSEPAAPTSLGGDDTPYVYAGSLVVRGQGIAEVGATGPRSEIGRIGAVLGSIESEPPRLTVQTRRLVRVLAVVGLVLTLMATLLFWMWRGGWLEALLSGIALGMSMLPEEFPLVLTVFMVMGAWRIAKVNVLTRRASAIETLGAATVLCTDKTGTLTENRMTIAELHVDGTLVRVQDRPASGLSPACRTVIEFGILASDIDPFDPMEKAFVDLGHAELAGTGRLHADYALKADYGIRPDLLAVAHVWSAPGAPGHIVAAKGAPEAIARLTRLDPDTAARVTSAADDMARRGMRVLGVARGAHPDGPLPDRQTGFDLTFLGLVGLADPLRTSVPAAVAECRSAGIRVVMITGDYPVTAQAIARSAGIIDARQATEDGIVTGEQLSAMSDAELRACVRDCAVFARTRPAQKLRIVEALKANGEIVAMTGDGVNDAPSVKAAHIGIAMGGRGTDVAREASSIVLLDDDFGSIVKTVRLGRRIYDNLRKAMGYVLAMHVPIAGLALLPLLLGWPLVLTPVHIAFLEMVIDPVCSIVFEAETDEDDIMRRPPRDPSSPLLSPDLIGWFLLQGGVALAVVAGAFGMALWQGMPEAEARALAFASLVAGNIGLIFVNRSHSASIWTGVSRPNAALWIVLGTIAVILAITLWWGPLARLFRFAPLSPVQVLIALGAGVAIVVILDALKPLWGSSLRS